MTQHTQKTKYITLDELRHKLGGRSRSSIYRDIDQGRIPKPVKFGVRLYWLEGSIDALLNQMAQAA